MRVIGLDTIFKIQILEIQAYRSDPEVKPQPHCSTHASFTLINRAPMGCILGNANLPMSIYYVRVFALWSGCLQATIMRTEGVVFTQTMGNKVSYGAHQSHLEKKKNS